MTRFSGKTCFITGGASGMGKATALMLLSEGARIAVFDQADAAPEFREFASSMITFKGDVSDATAVRDAVSATGKRFGRLDLAVNAAGIHGTHARIVDQDDDAFDGLLNVNIRGMFLSMKYEAQLMRQGGGGAIVNFSSVFSQRSMSTLVLYGATKHAVVGLTTGAAVEFAEYNVRVNAVSPGPIHTPFLGQLSADATDFVSRSIPQKRIGQPAEVAGAVAWLLSDQATYITGANLVIDGGQSVQL